MIVEDLNSKIQALKFQLERQVQMSNELENKVKKEQELNEALQKLQELKSRGTIVAPVNTQSVGFFDYLFGHRQVQQKKKKKT